MVTSEKRGDSSVSHTLFLWIISNGLAWPQLWTEDWRSVEDRMTRVVFKHELTQDDRGLSLNDLAKKYPLEKING